MTDDWQVRRSHSDAKRLVSEQLRDADISSDDVEWRATKIVHLLLDAGWSPHP